MKIWDAMIHYFTKLEILLWSCSAGIIFLSFLLFDRGNMLTPTLSLLGVTAIIINAKGNPLGQFLMILFSLFYGMISYSLAYYGEVMTYFGMTMPMAAFSLISWLRHPYQGNKAQVQVNRIGRKEIYFMWILTAVVTIVFYFILKFFHTANLLPSTISVTTSFAAVYLTFRRSPYFSIAYAANDIILIILWTCASMEDIKYVSITACFAAFFINDIYGFISWKNMEKRQTLQTLAEK